MAKIIRTMHRRARFPVAVFFSILIVIILSHSSATAEDWPMFLKTKANIPYISGTIPDELEILWEADLNGESYSSPIIVDNRVFIGSGNDFLYCFDAEDGSLLWEFESTSDSQSDYGLCSTPCVYDGRVYFGTSDFYAFCLDAETGDEIWSHYLVLETHPDANYGACASPIVHNGKVFFGTDSYEADSDANQNAPNLFCLDADGNGDGTTDVIWSYISPDDGFIYSTPAIKGNKMVIGTWSNKGEVICLDTEGNGDGTTSQYWRFSMPYQTMASPTIHGNTVYIGDGAFTVDRPSFNVYAIDLDSSGDLPPLSEEWHYTGDAHFVSSAVPYNDNIYIGDLGGTIHCIDTNVGFSKTANADWTVETGYEIWATPTIVDDKLIIGNFNGDLYCLKTSDGSEVWTIHLSDAEIYTSVAIVDDNLYVSTNDGKLFCLGEKGSGPNTDNSPPTLNNGAVTPLGGDDTELYTFSIEYVDIDDDDPDTIKIYINGVGFDMSVVSSGVSTEYDGIFTNGERYEYGTYLDPGTHSYNFEATDGQEYVYTDSLALTVTSSSDNDNDNGNGNDGDGDNTGSDSTNNENSTPAFELLLIIFSILICCLYFRSRKGRSIGD
jgi:outer membrane protein assembly factor BamB